MDIKSQPLRFDVWTERQWKQRVTLATLVIFSALFILGGKNDLASVIGLVFLGQSLVVFALMD